MGAPLPYDTIEALRSRMAEVAPGITKVDERQPALYLNGAYYKVQHPQPPPFCALPPTAHQTVMLPSVFLFPKPLMALVCCWRFWSAGEGSERKNARSAL